MVGKEKPDINELIAEAETMPLGDLVAGQIRMFRGLTQNITGIVQSMDDEEAERLIQEEAGDASDEVIEEVRGMWEQLKSGVDDEDVMEPVQHDLCLALIRKNPNITLPEVRGKISDLLGVMLAGDEPGRVNQAEMKKLIDEVVSAFAMTAVGTLGSQHELDAELYGELNRRICEKYDLNE